MLLRLWKAILFYDKPKHQDSKIHIISHRASLPWLVMGTFWSNLQEEKIQLRRLWKCYFPCYENYRCIYFPDIELLYGIKYMHPDVYSLYWRTQAHLTGREYYLSPHGPESHWWSSPFTWFLWSLPSPSMLSSCVFPLFPFGPSSFSIFKNNCLLTDFSFSFLSLTPFQLCYHYWNVE